MFLEVSIFLVRFFSSIDLYCCSERSEKKQNFLRALLSSAALLCYLREYFGPLVRTDGTIGRAKASGVTGCVFETHVKSKVLSNGNFEKNGSFKPPQEK